MTTNQQRPRRVVLFYGDDPSLLIYDIVWKDDQPVSGIVENGAWEWPKAVPNIAPYTRWAPVPEGMRGDYNAVLEKMRKSLPEKGGSE